MYFSDPITPSALAMTGITAAHGFVSAAVLLFAGLAAITIARQLAKRRTR